MSTRQRRGSGRPQTWYHGGRPGLQDGQRLLPPDISRTLTATQILTRLGFDSNMEPDRARTDLVYLTSAVDLARAYAGGWQLTGRGPYGTLYQAVPGPGAEPDPDFEEAFPGLCIQARYAVVRRTVQTHLTIAPDDFRRAMLKYTTWEPGPCPRCGHDAQTAKPHRCLSCLCDALRYDPTALQRVLPASTR
jgi:hypothetical protein